MNDKEEEKVEMKQIKTAKVQEVTSLSKQSFEKRIKARAKKVYRDLKHPTEPISYETNVLAELLMLVVASQYQDLEILRISKSIGNLNTKDNVPIRTNLLKKKRLRGD